MVLEMSTLFDINDVPAHCVQCGEDIEDASELRDDDNQCHQCYINEDCPVQCNGEHDNPEPNYDGQWMCETTGTEYEYTGPDTQRGFADLGNWNPSSTWSDGTRELDGYWYPADEIYSCDSCSGQIHSENSCWLDDYCYCQGCYQEARENDDEDDDYSPRRSGGSESEPLCGHPHEYNHHCKVTHFDPITEITYCEEHAPMKSERIDGNQLVAA